MMNENDAHSGANPEPIAEPKPELQVEPESDDDVPAYVLFDGGTIGDPNAKFAPDDAAAVTEQPLPVPEGGALPLLEAQLGEVLKIMQDFATWIHQPNTSIHTCVSVADSVARLVQASAVIGKVAAQLQNGDPESRHRVIVEYAGPDGGGVARSRKRINHGRA
jgi:hypothetical protein